MNKCICGYSYEGLRDSHYKTGENIGNVLPHKIKRHCESESHKKRMNQFRKPFNKVIIQLNYLLNGLENELIFEEIRRHILICKNLKKKNNWKKGIFE